MAPLQKRAWYGLVTGVAFAIALIVVFIAKGGVTQFTEDQSFRILIDALLVGWLLVYGVMMASLLKLRRSQKGKVVIDERDRMILEKAPLIQLWAVILSLAAWAIGLTEIYWDARHVPVMYLYIIFFSSLIVSTVAQSLGILIGYWRGIGHG